MQALKSMAAAYGPVLDELHRVRHRPKSRYNEVVRFVEGGLRDLSISRASLSWGVPFPDDSVDWVTIVDVRGVAIVENVPLSKSERATRPAASY